MKKLIYFIWLWNNKLPMRGLNKAKIFFCNMVKFQPVQFRGQGHANSVPRFVRQCQPWYYAFQRNDFRDAESIAQCCKVKGTYSLKGEGTGSLT
jgi:hypothetical protein